MISKGAIISILSLSVLSLILFRLGLVISNTNASSITNNFTIEPQKDSSLDFPLTTFNSDSGRIKIEYQANVWKLNKSPRIPNINQLGKVDESWLLSSKNGTQLFVVELSTLTESLEILKSQCQVMVGICEEIQINQQNWITIVENTSDTGLVTYLTSTNKSNYLLLASGIENDPSLLKIIQSIQVE